MNDNDANQNVAIVRAIYGHFAREGEFAWEYATEDFEFDASGALPDVVGAHGREEAEPVFQSYMELFEDYFISFEEMIHADSEVVVTRVRDGGRLLGSERDISSEFFHVWTFRDDLVARWSSHTDADGALRAAGRPR